MEEARTEVKVMGVHAYPEDGADENHFMLLGDDRGHRVLIWVGHLEAWAISSALEKDNPERPTTHDSMMNLLALTGAVMEEVCINDLREETFYATGRVRVGDVVRELDLRPSDAVALALRVGCPISMADRVLEAVGQVKIVLEFGTQSLAS